jgi:methyltransferase (TIGR00027 family)
MRALDQARPADARIVDDPYAAWFLTPLSRAHLAAVTATGNAAGIGPVLLPALTGYIQVRHRYMDDCLRARLARGGIEQVVVLGAGYDMRAWRFADLIAGRPVFEVDYPSTAARKERILTAHRHELPPADVRRVTIDFQTQQLADVLGVAGFVPGRPTFFFWEGVSMYLRREAVKATLHTLHTLGGPGSALVMDFWQFPDEPDLLASAHRVSAGLMHVLAEPVTFALHPEDGPDFVRRLGWAATEVVDAVELRRRYVRDNRPVYPMNWCLYAER